VIMNKLMKYRYRKNSERSNWSCFNRTEDVTVRTDKDFGLVARNLDTKVKQTDYF